eukprot:3615449-Karenia_brevis.AAC.1
MKGGTKGSQIEDLGDFLMETSGSNLLRKIVCTYVTVAPVPGILKERYLDGSVDVTWWCTTCHGRVGESPQQTRIRIRVYDADRMERTTRLLQSGWDPAEHFKKSRWR